MCYVIHIWFDETLLKDMDELLHATQLHEFSYYL